MKVGQSPASGDSHTRTPPAQESSNIPSSMKLWPNSVLRIIGLKSKPQLNGKFLLFQKYNHDSGRIEAKTLGDDSVPLSLKPQNL